MLESDSATSNQKVQLQEHFLFLILMKTKDEAKIKKANKKTTNKICGNVGFFLLSDLSSWSTGGFISDLPSIHIQLSTKYNLTFIPLI